MQPVVVFVVEDEADLQNVIEAILEDGGFTAELASSGEEAIAMLDADVAAYRALLTDVDLATGKLTGWDVARHARELVPEMPVIYMTGGGANDWAALGVPNSVLLQKPFAAAQLTTALAGLLNAGGSMPGGPT